MEAATKNKRGRPEKFSKVIYAVWSDKEKRTAQNITYAGEIIERMQQKPGDFFITEKGNLRRQGIAEQIGRMFDDGYSEEDCIQIAKLAMKMVENGWTVKAVEQWIRTNRKTGEW